jgi:hypothetical protein
VQELDFCQEKMSSSQPHRGILDHSSEVPDNPWTELKANPAINPLESIEYLSGSSSGNRMNPVSTLHEAAFSTVFLGADNPSLFNIPPVTTSASESPHISEPFSSSHFPFPPPACNYFTLPPSMTANKNEYFLSPTSALNNGVPKYMSYAEPLAAESSLHDESASHQPNVCLCSLPKASFQKIFALQSISNDQRRTLYILVAQFIITIILWLIPFGLYIVFPFQLISVLFHELGHASMVALTILFHSRSQNYSRRGSRVVLYILFKSVCVLTVLHGTQVITHALSSLLDTLVALLLAQS